MGSKRTGPPAGREDRRASRRSGPAPGFDIVRTYLDEIGQYSLLNRDEEARLGEAIQLGLRARRRLDGVGVSDEERSQLVEEVADGERAREHFVEANLRLVVAFAKRYRRPGVELLDLVQAGNIGLLRAVERFDWHRGNRFSTYAMWWIRQSVLRELSYSGRGVRLPAHIRERVIAVFRVRDSLRVELGHEPDIDELSTAMNSEPERVEQLVSLGEEALSLSLPTGGGDESQLEDALADPDASDPGDEAIGLSLQEEIRGLLSHISDHEAEVLRLRFGFDGAEPRSLEEVGRQLGISRERVRQLEVRALHRLQRDDTALALRSVA